MSFLRKAMCFILILSCVFTAVGCSRAYIDAYIYFELLDKPATLDAQIASGDCELMIVRNIYEGLLRKNNEGEIVCGAAEEYSYKNFTYTFNLRRDLKWSDGTSLTAHDFVFAFKRAVLPETKAPFADSLFSIENAEAIYNGSAPSSSLGVEAVDDYTLLIKLCREDENFENTLTSAVCMPCNEEFFNECKGKYGLKSEFIISNGSYKITKWNREEFGIRLYKNEQYGGEFEANNAAVFISCDDEMSQGEKLLEGNSDMAFIASGELDTLPEEISLASVQNKCWVLSIGNQYSAEVKRAFGMAFSGDVYKEHLVKGFTVSYSIYPEILGVQDAANGVGLTVYDIEGAYSLMSSQIAEMPDKQFPSAVLYYYDSDGAKEMARAIVGHWQQKLSAFINIEASDSLSVLQAQLGLKDLPFAIFPVTATNTSLQKYLKTFGIVGNSDATAAQKQLIEDASLIPIAYENTNIAYKKTLEGVCVEVDNGYIDFSFIIKYE